MADVDTTLHAMPGTSGEQRGLFDPPVGGPDRPPPTPGGATPAPCSRCGGRRPNPGCGGLCLRCWAIAVVAPGAPARPRGRPRR